MPPLAKPEELQHIISKNLLSSVFQPIVDLEQREIFGYEALTRGPANSALHSPLVLFNTASRHGMMAELEYACREVACESFVRAGANGKLFINISPMSLTERGYRHGITDTIIERLGFPAERIVIELSEQYPLENYQLLRTATNHFRERGFEIAIDDLGSGYAGLRAWSELLPDYVKIDRHFIEHIDTDPVKREFVRSIQKVAKELKCRVIAEGIETQQELITLQNMGMRYGQGYFLGRPETSPENEKRIQERLGEHSTTIIQSTLPRLGQTAADIIQNTHVIPASMTLPQANQMFLKNKVQACIPVVEDNRPIGMLERESLLEVFSQRYAHELYERKLVTEFMNTECLQVSHDTTLEEVSRKLTDNIEQELPLYFIVTHSGLYYGVAKTSELLKRITEQQIINARHASPLTGLPGNVPLHEHLDSRLKNGSNFHAAYFDLNDFKPFNDHYGYASGDQAIITLAKLLKEHTCEQSDFVAHIGGDDFMVVFESEDWFLKCENIVESFSDRIVGLYDQEAVERGGISSISRAGEREFFPLLSLSVGVSNPDSQHCNSFHDVSALSTEAKKQAKKSPGNSIFVSRRQSPNSRHADTIPLKET